MKKIAKIGGWIVGVFVLLLIVLAVVLQQLVDGEAIKKQAADLVRENLGRELVIQGDVEPTVLPWLGIRIGKLALGNAPGFGNDPFLALDEVSARIKLIPLFSGKIEVDVVTLNGLNLNLAKLSDGKTNWDDLVGGQTKEEPPAEATDKATDVDALLKEFSLGGVNVRDARIQWDDQAAGQKILVGPVNVTIGQVRYGAPLEIKIDGQANLSNPAIQNVFEVAVKGNFETDTQRITVSNLSIKNEAKGDVLPGGAINLTLQSEASVDLKQQLLKVSNLQLDVLNLKVTGNLSGEQIQSDPKFKGELNIESDSVGKLLQQVGMKSQGLDKRLTGVIAFNAGTASASLDNVDIKIDTMQLRSSLNATSFQPLAATAKVSLQNVNPKEWLNALAIEVPPASDETVLRQLSLEASANLADDKASVSDLQIVLDDTKVTGSLSVAQFAKPAIGFNVKVDRIDVDRYLPAPSKEETAKAEQASASTNEEVVLIDEPTQKTLQALNVDGSATIGSLKVKGLKANDIQIQIKAKDGVISVVPKQALLYQGKISGDVTLDVRKKPIYKTALKVQGVDTEALLSDLGTDLPVVGKVNLDLNTLGSGFTLKDLLSGLNGDGLSVYTDGAIKGVNIPYEIRRLNAKFKGQTLSEEDKLKRTDFSRLDAGFSIKDGKLHNDKLEAKAPLLRVQGGGSMTLVDQVLDYSVISKITATTKGEGGADFQELNGLELKLNIIGPATDPSIKLDEEHTLKQLAKLLVQNNPKAKAVQEKVDQLEEKKEEKKEEIKEEAKEKLKNKLKGLFR